jgi:hypothetical protein
MPSALLDNEACEQLLHQHRASAEKRAALLEGTKPFSVEAWLRDSVPASPEELGNLDQFLADLETERNLSLIKKRVPG